MHGGILMWERLYAFTTNEYWWVQMCSAGLNRYKARINVFNLIAASTLLGGHEVMAAAYM